MNHIHITGYKFIFLQHLEQLQQTLLNECCRLNLIGTILLSSEGINVNLAGFRETIDEFNYFFKQLDSAFSDILLKETLSESRPYKRLLVKVKEEIITFQQSDAVPLTQTATHLAPKLFKQWLDEGQELVVIDTRNEYEIEHGTFENAHNLHIQQFTDFPRALAEQLGHGVKNKRVVIFCTGGIRCEKAGAAMQQAGYQDVYQLEGGIINYFSECGDSHYNGECFVFDDRVKISENDCVRT